jgi:hypothetical protein
MSQADSPNTTSPSRRALLAGAPAAAVAALAAGTVANGPAIAAAARSAVDPIFAVIEAYERVVGQKSALYARSGEFEAVLPEEQRTWSIHFGGEDRWPPQGCADAPEWIDNQLGVGEIVENQCDLEVTLLTTAPTTIEGAIALLAHLGAGEFPEERGLDGVESLFTVAGLSYDKRVANAADAFPAALAGALRKIVAA